MTQFSIVVAMAEDGSIGYYDKEKQCYDLPWSCKDDLKFFKNLTCTNLTGEIPNKKNVVIMGKNTYLSLPKKILNDRINIIISSTYDEWRYNSHKNIIVFPLFQTALDYCNSMQYQHVYVIGGEQLYNEALKHNSLGCLIVSIIPFSYFKDNVLPTSFFPLKLNELQQYSEKTLLYKKNFLKVFRFK
jgi:dihydrofolate reductase